MLCFPNEKKHNCCCHRHHHLEEALFLFELLEILKCFQLFFVFVLMKKRNEGMNNWMWKGTKDSNYSSTGEGIQMTQLQNLYPCNNIGPIIGSITCNGKLCSDPSGRRILVYSLKG